MDAHLPWKHFTDMAEQVFRITFWTRLANSNWRQKKKNLYDSEFDFKRGMKSYRRMVDRKQGGMLLVRVIFEEFLGGDWAELERYPEDE